MSRQPGGMVVALLTALPKAAVTAQHQETRLMNSLGLHTSAVVQPALSPRLQRAVRLLQMSSQEFAQAVRDALDSNPFLEQEETAAPADTGGVPDGTIPPESPRIETWAGEVPARQRYVDGDGAVFDTLEAPASLASHLLGQLTILPLTQRDLTLTHAVVESLDDDGYLRTPLEELAEALPLLPAAHVQELQIALRRVQALDPPGIAARSVAECLQLQLSCIPAARDRALAGAILRDHIDALAAHDVRALAKWLDCSHAAVSAACTAIRRLDPHPGWRFAQPSVHYITPDVIAKKHRGQWTVILNEAVVPRVRLNRSYAELFQRYRDAQHGELGAHLQEAKWTIRNLELRFSTILNVAQAILKRQQHFLAYGPMAMKPLALREIAQEVGVHESTVSRVTNNKFMATPYGVFELKYFFSRALATAAGGECSPTAVRGLIQEMIATETPGCPLSDVELARQLESQGLKVARRTVTKYRQLLRIEPAERRRGQAPHAAGTAERPPRN
jgi:RNA polymerase sigma-54 factor